MGARVRTVAFQGIEAVPVDVQAQITTGLPVAVVIVGLPDKAIREASERVRAALLSSGLSLPPKRIVVNLAPADLPKEGSHYDLPIALALMAVIGAFPADALDGYVALGELGLDGRLAPTSGILPAAIAAHARGLGVICPAPSGPEAAWAGDDVDIIAPDSLLALVNHLGGYQLAPRPSPKRHDMQGGLPDLSEVRGQEVARRALELAAAGGHNLLIERPLLAS
ncbi:MAG: ATP-binding protein [Devosia sp.]|nr:ATP-binding protein [Devosia sp.]